MSEYVLALRNDAAKWCRGRFWIWRVPILLYLSWEGLSALKNPYTWNIFAGITLGIHEMGHVIFAFAGDFICAAGGSFCQVAAPIITILLFLKQREYFGMSVAGIWLSLSLFHLATYIGDAQAQQLPLVSIGGGDAMHDWTFLLERMNMIEQDAKIAGFTRLAGAVALFASIAGGTWLCWLMVRSGKAGPEDQETIEYW